MPMVSVMWYLNLCLNGSQALPGYYSTRRKFLRLLLNVLIGGARQSLAFGVGMVAYHLGARSEHLRQCAVK